MFHSFGISKYSMFNNFDNEYQNKYKHLLKTEKCENQQIQLFHIFENEWLNKDKKEIWKSILKNALLLNEEKIFARKCILKEIKDNIIIKHFLNENHIQGYCNSKIKLGLYYNNELVSIMTFGKARFNKNINYELLRFCSKKNINIIGGGSKLLKYFKNKYLQMNETLISYGNRRWTYKNKNFYKQTGFKEINQSFGNYYYFYNKNVLKLYHRTIFQKHKIKKYYNNKQYNIIYFNNKETETFNMYKNGYRKIYDSGQLVFLLKKEKND